MFLLSPNVPQLWILIPIAIVHCLLVALNVYKPRSVHSFYDMLTSIHGSRTFPMGIEEFQKLLLAWLTERQLTKWKGLLGGTGLP